MAQYEYKVVPAPTKGEKAKGVKQPDARFARSVEGVLNQMAAQGWEFQRAEMLPNEERSGLSKTSKEWRNLLIFRRERTAEVATESTETPLIATTPAPPIRPEPTRPEVVAAPAAPEAAEAREETFEPPEPVDITAPTPFEKLSVKESTTPVRPLRGWRDRS